MDCQLLGSALFLNLVIMKEQEDTLKLHKKRVMTDLREHFFSDRIVNKWNILSEDVRLFGFIIEQFQRKTSKIA